ncbi:MAG: hypothetical protein E7331_03320 [Clostridiales bacterium]|nr:hypothetical protein [Clostridiales bacterium]
MNAIPETKKIPEKISFKKGFIAALFLGVVMIYIVPVLQWLGIPLSPYGYDRSVYGDGFRFGLYQLVLLVQLALLVVGAFFFNRKWIVSAVSLAAYIVLLLVFGTQNRLMMAQIAVAVVGICFLNKNWIVSVASLAVYVVLLLLEYPLQKLFTLLSEGSFFYNDKYTAFTGERIIEFVLVACTLFALNRGKKPVAIGFALFSLVWTAMWLFMSYMDVDLSDCISNGVYSLAAMCKVVGYYGELLFPLTLLICAIKPSAIRTSIKVIDGFMAIRVALFAASFVILGKFNLMYLINTCWIPLIMILGLNAVLLFPHNGVDLAWLFVKCIFFAALFVLLVYGATAAEQNRQSAREREEEERERYMLTMRNNMASWQEAGFSDTFTVEAAQSMLNEGRISYQEYKWLLSELLGKG